MTREEKLKILVEHCAFSVCPTVNPGNATCKIGKSAAGAVLCERKCFCDMTDRELDMLVRAIQMEDKKPEKKPDEVNHPEHYQGKVECIDEMVAVFGKGAVINFCALNVWKYRYRADKKGGDKDREKADWYIQKIIELKNGA